MASMKNVSCERDILFADIPEHFYSKDKFKWRKQTDNCVIVALCYGDRVKENKEKELEHEVGKNAPALGN